ncbi:MAG TPA: DUF1565 domain-containing protein [Polyangiaceae bacterium]|nr:DUF1565 domain-containing protein [Polyangiaceae bacterium]
MSVRVGSWLIAGLGLFVGCGGRSELSLELLDGGHAGSAGSAGGHAGVAATAGAFAVGGRAGGSGGGGASNGGSAFNGGSAGSPSGGSDNAGSASAGMGGTAGMDRGPGWYVDPILGSDENPGNFAAPFKTLEHAASVASSGETVWLFDGTYDESTEPRFANWPDQDCTTGAGVSFAEGVQLEALNSGQPHLVTGSHGLCLSGGAVRGLQLECGAPGGHAVEVSSGIQGISGSSFTGCGNPASPATNGVNAGLVVSGDARVTLTAGNLADYSGHPNYAFAAVSDDATLTVGSGTLSTLTSAFALSGTAHIDLEGVEVTAQNSARRAGTALALLDGTPTVTLSGSTIRNYSAAIHVGDSNPNLIIDNSTIVDTNNGILALRLVPGSLRASITNSRFERLDAGLLLFPFSGPVDISVSNSEFKTVNRPILTAIGGALSLTDVTISDCYFGAAVSARPGLSPLSATFRRVSVTGSQAYGISLSGRASTLFDLGTSAAPGGNLVRDNNLGASGSSNLVFYSESPILISAIGNSWTPNTQGTDANGQCSVAAEEQSLDLTNASGPNFTSQNGNQAILRLSEKGP